MDNNIMCDDLQGAPKGCHCRESRVRGFIQARLLLKIAQKPAYGYELLDAINQDDQSTFDPGGLYRALRSMEEDGLVLSSWDTSGGGPARRIYKLTDLGFEYLDAWAINIRKTSQSLNSFLKEYESKFKEKRSTSNG
jgi:PadR family transcriptional regulator, regulatory protein PadR